MSAPTGEEDPIDFLCPLCHVSVLLNSQTLGRQIDCPSCGRRVVVVLPGQIPRPGGQSGLAQDSVGIDIATEPVHETSVAPVRRSLSETTDIKKTVKSRVATLCRFLVGTTGASLVCVALLFVFAVLIEPYSPGEMVPSYEEELRPIAIAFGVVIGVIGLVLFLVAARARRT